MIIFKLALKNLLGAGLRSWLNVFILSISFVAIITMQGLLEGTNRQAAQAVTDAECGGGQIWHPEYDPYDPLRLEDSHGAVPASLDQAIQEGRATPILIFQGTIYPKGRIRPVLLKGIDPGQKILSLPSSSLEKEADALPAFIGTRMAKSSGLRSGDLVTVRWRDASGAFDARELQIVEIMSTPAQSVDVQQVWIPLERLQEMTAVGKDATLVVLEKKAGAPSDLNGWIFRDTGYLLKDFRKLIQAKSKGMMFMYFLLLSLAMVAIFDTQILSIFKRRREMGTLMALGFTRMRVIGLFTFEGALNGVLAALAGAVYGIPLFILTASHGWSFPESIDSYGYAIGTRIYPSYSAALIAGTTLLVFIITTVVSFLPTRQIAHLKPTEALRGKTA